MRLKQIRGRLSVFWSLNIAGWIAAACIIYFLVRATAERPDVLLSYVLINYPLGLLLTGGMRYIYRRLYLKSSSFVSLAALAAGSSMLGAALWLATGDLVSRTFQLMPELREVTWPQIVTQLIFERGFILLIWSALYLGIKSWRDLQAQKMQLMEQSMLAHQAQLQMLRYQLNPHFLFNALNSIRALIREDALRSEKMVTELSEFLRYTLLNKNLTDVTFGDELEAIRNYLAIEKIRFEERLKVDFAIEPETESFQVPGFLIHPLIENAIKYGMQTSATPLQICVRSSVNDSQFRIEVTNTGRWLAASSSDDGTGVGLRNVRERLRQRYGPQHKFELYEQDGRVHAVIEIYPQEEP